MKDFALAVLLAYSIFITLIISVEGEENDAKLLDKDSICVCKLNYQDSVHHRNVTKILGE